MPQGNFLKNILKELRNIDNAILFIDEIHVLLDNRQGNTGAGNVLKSELSHGDLTVIGDYFDNEVSVFTQRLLSMLEPAITIVLAVVTVILLLAVYLPMFTMYGSIV